MVSSVGLFDANEQLNSHFLVLRVSLLPQVREGGRVGEKSVLVEDGFAGVSA